jgi:hypothetical protein
MRVALAAGIALILVLAAPSQAQDLSKMCDKVRSMEVGQWAEYQMAGTKPEESGRMRLAIIGTKDVAGTKAYWVEMKMNSGAGAVVTQVLTGGYPFKSAQIHEMIVKAGDQPAMKMPAQAVAMASNRIARTPSLGAVDKCEQAKIVGWESVTVPAGEFRGLHLKPVDANVDVWALDEVPFGLLKSQGSQGKAVLVGHGKDAKSSIREKPISIPGMGGF